MGQESCFRVANLIKTSSTAAIDAKTPKFSQTTLATSPAR